MGELAWLLFMLWVVLPVGNFSFQMSFHPASCQSGSHDQRKSSPPKIRVFLYVDNEAARASLIRMFSSILLHNALLKELNKVALARSLFLWSARVPSASNPADAPSGAEIEEYEERIKAGACQLCVQWSQVDADV